MKKKARARPALRRPRDKKPVKAARKANAKPRVRSRAALPGVSANTQWKLPAMPCMAEPVAPKPPVLDMAMELLCSLPKPPDMVPVSLLAQDLGSIKHEAVLALRKKLCGLGINILVHNSDEIGDGRYLSIARTSAAKADRAARKYWARTHP